MRQFLWIIAIIGAALGGLALVGGILAAKGAPQEAAAAAIALGLAAIPYCMARAWDELSRPKQG